MITPLCILKTCRLPPTIWVGALVPNKTVSRAAMRINPVQTMRPCPCSSPNWPKLVIGPFKNKSEGKSKLDNVKKSDYKDAFFYKFK